MGVLLYKIVFHLEKVEAKKERRKDTQDSVFERLVVNVDTLGGGEDGEASEVEEERIPARSVELMDRRGVQASPRKFDPQMSFESPS